MSEILFDTKAYAKIILHAAKYPHCAVNGILLCPSNKAKDGNRLQNLHLTDAVPLFHQCLNLSPMAEIALTQIDVVAQSAGLTIAGYYAACENFYHNTVDKCPGIKIAEKIQEEFPAAVFVVLDNSKLLKHSNSSAIQVSQSNDGKWKINDQISFSDSNVFENVSTLLQGAQKDLVDFDNHLDDITLDWSNNAINMLIHTMD